MNKGIIIGAIVATAIAIGVISVISYSSPEDTVNEGSSTETETVGKNFTITLSEGIGVESTQP